LADRQRWGFILQNIPHELQLNLKFVENHLSTSSQFKAKGATMQLLQEHKAFSKVLSKMIAQSWCDPTFKKEFINNPESKFAAAGVMIPENVNLQLDPSACGNLKIEQIFDELNNSPAFTYKVPLAAKAGDVADEDLTAWTGKGTPPIIPTCCC
jgi:hypothetical protein